MREGGVVGDARGGGYNATLAGKSLGHFKSRGGAFKAIAQAMERDQFYPNVFYVNDRGNTNLMTVRLDNGKVMTRLVKSWV